MMDVKCAARWRLPAAVVMAAAALLAGCDPQRVEKLEEGVSTEADVRKQFGEPASIIIEPDGSRSFEYPRQPEGWTNYLITIGKDGKMSALRQLLNDDNFARVQPGLSGMQVRQMLGKPAKLQHYDLKNEDVMEWRYKPRGQESRIFSVTFSRGKVVSTAVADDPRDNGGGR